MTRTNKGKKGPGYEFWSRRTPKGVWGFGRWVKMVTHRLDRRKAKERLGDTRKDD